MSKFNDEIKEAIREIAGGDTSVFQGVVAEVDETEFTCTVRRDDAVDYFDVRLRGLVNGELQGFAFIPKIDSVVLAAHIGKSNELYICQYTEIDKVIFTNNDFELLLDTEITEIKKGDNIIIRLDGEVISVTNEKSVAEMKADVITLSNDKSTAEIKGDVITLTNGGSTAEIKNDVIQFNGGELGGLVKLDQVQKNLDSLKTFVEAIHAALPGAFSAIMAGLSSNGALGATAYNGSMAGQMIRFENMENKKVKH